MRRAGSEGGAAGAGGRGGAGGASVAGSAGDAGGEHRFELTGGALCLDLANTVDSRPTESRRDFLTTYDDLLSWGTQAGAVTRGEADALRSQARRNPAGARRTLAAALRAREAIFAILSAEAHGVRPPPEALATLESALPTAFAHLRLRRGAGGYELAWDDEPHLERVVWPALRSAAELLTSPDLRLTRVCASEACDWLFVDRSRNQSRRWCDMNVCGNRHKVREHYRRQRGAG